MEPGRPGRRPERQTDDRLPATRDLAIVQTAIYDAVNAIDRTSSVFRVHAHVRGKASPVAAAAAAGLVTASALFPNDTALFQATYQASLADANGRARTRGLAVGNRVAEATLSSRAADGSDTVVNYTREAPGCDRGRPHRIRAGPDAAMAQCQAVRLAKRLPVSPTAAPGLTARIHGRLQQGQGPRERERADRTAQQDRVWPGSGRARPAPPSPATGTGSRRTRLRPGATRWTGTPDCRRTERDAGRCRDRQLRCSTPYNRWRRVDCHPAAADQDGNPDTVADPSWLPLNNTANNPS